jgi:cellulose synthase operon protein YhjU
MMDAFQFKDKNQLQWHDLDGWNYYFLVKLALLWYGVLNFHPFANLVFLAFLLFPVPSQSVHRWRNWIAIPIGFAVFYHDTWLPGLNSIASQGTNVFSFSSSYLLQLFDRFINWQIIGLFFVLFVGYLFLSQWIRITALTVIALVYLNMNTLRHPVITVLPEHHNLVTNSTAPVTTQSPQVVALSSSLPPTNANLNAYLNDFYQQQKSVHTVFPNSLASDAIPFDVLFIHICSLAWADIDAVHLRDHPIWGKFDILFSEFNSASSYSGPAAIRLLRASCGQTTHDELYKPAPKECYIMDNLAKLGFAPEMMLDHEGTFDDFLKEVRQNIGLEPVPLMSREGISPDLIAFNGQLLSNDGQLLNRWVKQQNTSNSKRSVTYFNEISLHDGNTFIGESKPAPYKVRLQSLLDLTDNFFSELEASGRKTVVVFITENWANLNGDKLQIPGLRDIPSPDITHIPVGIKLIGLKSKPMNGQITINEPSSYLAVSEFIAQLVNGNVFNQVKVNLEPLTKNLPKTAFVSSNDGVTVMKYQSLYYILLKGDTNWVPYP